MCSYPPHTFDGSESWSWCIMQECKGSSSNLSIFLFRYFLMNSSLCDSLMWIIRELDCHSCSSGNNKMKLNNMKFKDQTNIHSVSGDPRQLAPSTRLPSLSRDFAFADQIHKMAMHIIDMCWYMFWRGLQRDNCNAAFVFSDTLHEEISQAVSWNERNNHGS